MSQQPGLFDDERGVPPAAETAPAPPKRQAKTGSATPKRVVLIDGHALAYRSYFAIQNLTTSHGQPVQAIFGFLRVLMKLLRDGGSKKKAVSDEHCVIVVFDAPAKSFRHENYEHYKAGRAATPDDLPAQIRKIKELVDLMGLTRYEQAGFEADDIIGTLARHAETENLEVRILTTDRDAYQLLSDRVKVLNADYQEIGPDEVQAKYGVSVAQWVDYRALTGDASDNIPGAKGVGPKTAQKLLETYGSLEHILAHLQPDDPERVQPEKVADKILESYENVLFSRELSRIVTSVDVHVDFAAAKVREPDAPRLIAALRDLEFTSFLKELGLENRREIRTAEWTTPGADAVFGFVLADDDAVAAELTGLAYAGADGEVREAPEPGLDALGANRVLRAPDAKALAVHALSRGRDAEPGDDPLLMAYVIDPANAEPQRVTHRYLNEDWPRDAAGRAAAASALLKLLPGEMPPELKHLYDTMELPVSRVLARMEARGVRIDADYLRGLSEAFATRLAALETEIHELAGEAFSIASRDQLERVLYDKLGLASSKKTKLTGKRSTAVSALEPLRDEHPIVERILEHRELSKLRGTYLDPLPLLVNPRTGRLHTTFAQTATATGRLSSLNPNLQNIPVRTEVGRDIRKGFIAADGFKLVAADYSQIELRILAHITGEASLIEGFQRDEDIHRRTAATILGVPLDAVTADQRRGAKTVNYGVLYGMSAHRLANEQKIPYAEAAAFIEAYFAAYPGINRYLEDTKVFCRERGYVQDLFGRRRYLPEINAKSFPVREAAERAAINMPIQGTSAGIIKLAMVKLEPELDSLGARLLLQVHDELVVEAPDDRVEETSRVLCDVMEHAFELKVPLGVGVGSGDSWYDAK